jgi:hypothetical protein
LLAQERDYFVVVLRSQFHRNVIAIVSKAIKLYGFEIVLKIENAWKTV